jgi:hypothetical protein
MAQKIAGVVENGECVNIIVVEEGQEMEPNWIVQDSDGEVIGIGMLRDEINQIWRRPPDPRLSLDLEEVRGNLIEQTYTEAQGQLDFYGSNYSQYERDEWAKLDEEARQYVQDSSQGSALQAKANSGVNIDKLAKRVVERSDQFSALIGAVSEKRANLLELAYNTNDIEELIKLHDSYTQWPMIP